MMNNSVLCADIGTTSLKTALISLDGTVLAFSKQHFSEYKTAQTGEKWLMALKDACSEMKSHSAGICAACFSGNGPTIVSEDGTAVMWNDEIPESLIIPESCRTSLFIPKLLTFRTVHPEQWAKSRWLFSGPEYLIYRLTGSRLTILPEKRFTVAYWTDAQLQELEIPKEKLPVFLPPATNAGVTTDSITEYLGLAKPVPVFCGGPDFTVAMLGTGTVKSGCLCDRAGSSEGINMCTPFPVRAEGLRTLPGMIPELWNASWLIPESGTEIAVCRLNYGKSAGHEISFKELIEDSYNGKNDEGKRILDGLLKKFSDGIKTLRENAAVNGIPVSDIIMATGGQTANSLWMQKKAEAAGIRIGITECTDAELMGDAILAFTGLGEYNSIHEAAAGMVRPAKIYSP